MATAKKTPTKTTAPRAARKTAAKKAPLKRAYTRRQPPVEDEIIADALASMPDAEQMVQNFTEDKRMSAQISLHAAQRYDLRGISYATRGLFLSMLEDLGYVTEVGHHEPSMNVSYFVNPGLELNHINKMIRFISENDLNNKPSSQVIVDVQTSFAFGPEEAPVPEAVVIDGVRYERVNQETVSAAPAPMTIHKKVGNYPYGPGNIDCCN